MPKESERFKRHWFRIFGPLSRSDIFLGLEKNAPFASRQLSMPCPQLPSFYTQMAPSLT
jgi:hypothetical protein